MFIDSYEFFLPQDVYTINNPANLTISPCLFHKVTGKEILTSIGTTSDGQKVLGSKAKLSDIYLNSRKTYVFFKPCGMYVKGSIAYYLSNGAHNLSEIDREKFAWVVSDIESHLRLDGINASLNSGILQRLDFGDDMGTLEEVPNYCMAISLLPLYRHYLNVEINPDTGNPEIRNDEWGLAVYDKMNCFKEKQITPPEGTTGNLMRVELRLTTTRKIIAQLKFKTVGALLQNFHRVETCFRDFFKKLF